jgi:WD40 repeat protein
VDSTFRQQFAGNPFLADRQLAEVRDVQTGKLVFPRPSSNLVCSAFSPDDRWLAVARTNHLIQVLDERTGEVVVEMRGHTNDITALEFSSDSSLLVSASRDHTARIWRVPSREPLGAPLVHDRAVQRATFSADGRCVATATAPADKTGPVIQVWDVEKAAKLGAPITEINDTRGLFFGPSRHGLLVTGGEADNDVRIWDVAAEVKLVRTLAFYAMRCWDFSPDGRMLAIGTDVGFVLIWSTETWELQFPPFRHTGWVESVHFSPDGTRLLTTSDDGTAKIWSLKLPAEAARLSLPANFFSDAPAEANRPRGQTPGPIPVYLTDSMLHLIDPERLVEVQSLKAQPTNGPVWTWTAGSTGRAWAVCERAAGANSPQQITLWTQEKGSFRALVLPHPRPVTRMQFNTDDSQLLTMAGDSLTRVWRTRDGTVERTIAYPIQLMMLNIPILLQPFSPDCRSFLSVFTDPTNGLNVQLFDLANQRLTGRPFHDWTVFSGIQRARFSPDGTRLATVGTSQKGAIIDLGAGRLAVPQFKHGGDLLDVDWSPDGRRLITAGLSEEIKLWDAASGEMLFGPMVVDEWVTRRPGTSGGAARSCRWSADGRFIASRADSGRARVFDASTTEPVTPFLQHSGYIRWVCITPGNRLITASDPNLLRAWDLKPMPLPAEVIADYAKLLSGRKLTAAGVLVPVPAQELAELANSLRARAPTLFE